MPLDTHLSLTPGPRRFIPDIPRRRRPPSRAPGSAPDPTGHNAQRGRNQQDPPLIEQLVGVGAEPQLLPSIVKVKLVEPPGDTVPL
ncbi:hypothetical protein Raf01_09680 [Rugosimonospora africana]|uniref:Uncharacterized protein n=1 Tax=Rugosimonospora africana TaxID=556532 RepID=A0A8J3QLI8_9ACTN|nr:hypothetical protein Raf01_09680 [Rugosimonospora africana]